MYSFRKYGIKIDSVEENDAEFIVNIRIDEKRSRFISKTSSDIEQQINWIKKFKIREAAKEEYYFIGKDESDVKFATYRIYNFTDDTVEIGSFVSLPNYSTPKNIIKLDIFIKKFVFDNLNYQKLNFEVRKNNLSVVNYHKKLGAEVIKEDELNYYFCLDKNDFLEKKEKFKTILNTK